MLQFQTLLDEVGEIGFLRRLMGGVAYVEGLPKAFTGELVVFESGQRGQVLSLQSDWIEVLLFDKNPPRLGSRVARSGKLLQLGVGEAMLGRIIDPLGVLHDNRTEGYQIEEFRFLDVEAPGVMERKDIDRAFETGVAAVDLGVPLGVGQRELVIGDRKTGKRSFIRQAIRSHVMKDGVVVYALIGQRTAAGLELQQFLEKYGIQNKVIILKTTSADAPGLVYQTPYAAMSVAEFFKNKGKDVLIVLDDLTAHAHYYRELSLLAGRFPGRDAYPGDVFYLHSRLLERAGNFERGSITCLPVVGTVLGDISGYIQTNLMSMTDGHIYFDHNLYNQGRRPAVNQFLSVTRVGRQTQTDLLKSLSRELSSFLVRLEKLRQLQHFGGEVSEEVKLILTMGTQVESFFNQSSEVVVPLELNTLLLASLWSGFWKDKKLDEIKIRFELLLQFYMDDQARQTQIKEMLSQCSNFSELVVKVEQLREWLVGEKDGHVMVPTNNFRDQEKEKQKLKPSAGSQAPIDQKGEAALSDQNKPLGNIPGILPESMVPREDVGVK